MKNMKISAKLISSFLVVTALSVVLAGLGIFASVLINSNYTYMLEGPINRKDHLSEMRLQFTMMRYRTANYSMEVNNPDIILNTLTPQYQSAYAAFTESLNAYERSNDSDTRRDSATIKLNHDTAEKLRQLVEQFKSGSEKTREIALTGDYDAATTSLRNVIPLANEINELMDSLSVPVTEFVTSESDAMDTTAISFTIALIAISIICFIISLALAFYIAKIIGQPVRFIKDIITQIGVYGELKFSDEQYGKIQEHARCKDEIGESVSVLSDMVDRLVNVGNALESIANSDLTVEINTLSDKDTMGLALKKMTEKLNEMFGGISISTAQVSTGAKQIADGAQSLAQGSTQQAAAVEELSGTISELTEKTNSNADLARNAANLADTIKENAEKGTRQMDEMMAAVGEINAASQNINKIIKVIDDIAFQTNILALNAAVEAARAGQHGKGFAVVAEEVRNLAAKSADAAKDTGSMIVNSIEKAELGARIAGETAASLTDIVGGINESNEIIRKIATASQEQSAGISEINKGIDQVAQVVQQNSATAEQSAAASEQLSGQASMLEEMLSQYKLKGGENLNKMHILPPSVRGNSILLVPEKPVPGLNDMNYDKY